jgi:hypothetical protein
MGLFPRSLLDAKTQSRCPAIGCLATPFLQELSTPLAQHYRFAGLFGLAAFECAANCLSRGYPHPSVAPKGVQF